jgi:hypothetical protein
LVIDWYLYKKKQMIYRTYIDKDNTIVKNSYYNYGNKSTIDLFWGGRPNESFFSRYIFHFDIEELREKYNTCSLGDLSKVSHKLHFKYHGFDTEQNVCIPTSYTVCLSKINEYWEEGCGVSEDCTELCTNFARLNCSVSKAPSNYFYAYSSVTWEVPGVFSGTTSGSTDTYPYLLCQSFDCSTDDLILDVTDIVNQMILDVDDENHGFILSFHHDLEESIVPNIENHVVFFGKETNTYYKPYLETEYNHAIVDDRDSFYANKDNKLYLFVDTPVGPTNLDSDPIVNIYDDKNVLQFTLTGSCEYTGVYSVTLAVQPPTTQKCGMWKDEWTNLSINGRPITNKTLRFQILNEDDYYQIGNKTVIPKTNYSISFFGIKKDERIMRGDIRKIFVEVKNVKNPFTKLSYDNIFYKISIKENLFNELPVIPWKSINKASCDNFFFLDTSWMLPQKYTLDLKIVQDGIHISLPKEITFVVY